MVPHYRIILTWIEILCYTIGFLKKNTLCYIESDFTDYI